jgi:hypothetical protein
MCSLQKLEIWHGKLSGTGYKDHAASAEKIRIGNKEHWKIFICTQDHKTLEPTVPCKPHSSRERVGRVIIRVCMWVIKCLQKGCEGK